jgi:beta-lactam-binding protein with PASTA domain
MPRALLKLLTFGLLLLIAGCGPLNIPQAVPRDSKDDQVDSNNRDQKDADSKQDDKDKDSGKDNVDGKDDADKNNTDGKDDTDKKSADSKDDTDKSNTDGKDDTDKNNTDGKDDTDKNGTDGKDDTDKTTTDGKDDTDKNGTDGKDDTDKTMTDGKDDSDKTHTDDKDDTDKNNLDGKDDTDKNSTDDKDDTDKNSTDKSNDNPPRRRDGSRRIIRPIGPIIRPLPTARVRVPALRGLTLAQAQQVLAAAGLVMNAMNHPRHGRVVAQTPMEGTVVRQGTRVTISLQAPRGGVNPVPQTRRRVPNLRNMTLTQAQQALAAAGLSMQALNRPLNGRVVSQSPPAQTIVRPGTRVTIRLQAPHGGGVNPRPLTQPRVPQLRNMTLTQAQQALAAVGLVMKAVNRPANGRVDSQSPPAGKTVRQGATVTIYLKAPPGGGKKPKPVVRPRPTITPRPTGTIPRKHFDKRTLPREKMGPPKRVVPRGGGLGRKSPPPPRQVGKKPNSGADKSRLRDRPAPRVRPVVNHRVPPRKTAPRGKSVPPRRPKKDRR